MKYTCTFNFSEQPNKMQLAKRLNAILKRAQIFCQCLLVVVLTLVLHVFVSFVIMWDSWSMLHWSDELTGSNFYEIKFEHCWQNNHLISKLMGGGQFYHAQIITWLSMALLCQDVQMQKTFPENQLTLYSKMQISWVGRPTYGMAPLNWYVMIMPKHNLQMKHDFSQ